MRTRNTAAQVSRPAPNQPISGVVATAIAYGLQVCLKDQDSRELILADKKAGFFLMQDVVTEEDWSAEILKQEHFPDRTHSLLPVGSAASARPWDVIELEGTAHLGSSIDDEITAETKLATLAGKFEVWVDNETSGEVTGIVDRVLSPVTPGSGAFRISIRKPGSFAADPA
jgi:hypothetical protein